ncbi:MAG: MoxR family ATPase [Nodosilinea sp.]
MTSPESPQDSWQIYQGNNAAPHDDIEERLPAAPSWRPFGKDISPGVSRRKRRGKTFQTRPEEVKMVNAALYLRRPLLITGKPGTGKSSLAYSVAEELKLGEVLYWPITTRTTLKSGLYNYDAIGRLQEVKEAEASGPPDGDVDSRQAQAEKIAKFITLGPLGTALLPSSRPRVLLIDEIDKSDIDLPNDLLTLFEEGRFEVTELLRLEEDDPDSGQVAKPVSVRVRTAYSDREEITRKDLKALVIGGRITCEEFPLVILTSNGERDFPPPFLRRCLRLNMYEPDPEQLKAIVRKHFELATDSQVSEAAISQWVKAFLAKRDNKEQLATDQLLNALFMVAQSRGPIGDDMEEFINGFLLSPLDRPLAAKPKDRTTDATDTQR